MANIEALEQLRRVVLDAPDDRFDMLWFGKKTDCGTVCCAAGWAALDPWFQANTAIGNALPIDTRPDSERLGYERYCLFNMDAIDGDDSMLGPFDRLALIFDLGEDDNDALFNSKTAKGVTKAEVLANIDRLIRGEPAVPYGCQEDEEDEDW